MSPAHLPFPGPTMTPECVNTFSHLRSTLSSDLLIDTEVSIRLAKAAAVVAKLLKRVSSNKDLTHCAQNFRSSKLARIQQWNLDYLHQTRKTRFHLWCIQGILWKEEVPNIKIQKYAHSGSVLIGSAMSTEWTLPGADQLLTVSILTGRRPRLRLGTVCKRSMKEAGRHWPQQLGRRHQNCYSSWRQSVAAAWTCWTDERFTSLLQVTEEETTGSNISPPPVRLQKLQMRLQITLVGQPIISTDGRLPTMTWK